MWRNHELGQAVKRSLGVVQKLQEYFSVTAKAEVIPYGLSRACGKHLSLARRGPGGRFNVISALGLFAL